MGKEQKDYLKKAEELVELGYAGVHSRIASGLRAEYDRGYGQGFDAGRVYQKQIEPGAVTPTEGEAPAFKVTYVWYVPKVSPFRDMFVVHHSPVEKSAAQRAADAILAAWKGVAGKKDTGPGGESSVKSHDYYVGYSAGYDDSGREWQASGEAWIKAADEARKGGLERGRKEGYEEAKLAFAFRSQDEVEARKAGLVQGRNEGYAEAKRQDAEHIALINRDRDRLVEEAAEHCKQLHEERAAAFDNGKKAGEREGLGERAAYEKGFEEGKREGSLLHTGESNRAQLLDFVNTCTKDPKILAQILELPWFKEQKRLAKEAVRKLKIAEEVAEENYARGEQNYHTAEANRIRAENLELQVKNLEEQLRKQNHVVANLVERTVNPPIILTEGSAMTMIHEQSETKSETIVRLSERLGGARRLLFRARNFIAKHVPEAREGTKSLYVDINEFLSD